MVGWEERKDGKLWQRYEINKFIKKEYSVSLNKIKTGIWELFYSYFLFHVISIFK